MRYLLPGPNKASAICVIAILDHRILHSDENNHSRPFSPLSSSFRLVVGGQKGDMRDALSFSAAAAATVPKLPFCQLGSFPFLDLTKPTLLPYKTFYSHPLPSSSHPPHHHLPSRNPISASLRFVVAAAAAAEQAASMAAPSAAESKPFSVLFVCLGNICRSPAAEAVFRDLVRKRGLESKFWIDSAGTIGYHEGNPADSRMRAASKRRGIEVTSISRPIRPSDFKEFDLILAMDMQNRGGLQRPETPAGFGRRLGLQQRWVRPELAHLRGRPLLARCPP
ncbi:uncharacterized protein LOC120111907 [Phoenix dactylifera]|uniref:acid phosphatase n=1 Tax=Phoenix dactylifera TaxID=42345 RepID=A0A8B9AJZ1_PHODC|nr:uncharacterized protein LOC120111907 [Phoenix dactylifera]